MIRKLKLFIKNTIYIFQGDSGGPLVVQDGAKWYLGGLTSWGYGCGDGGVYTRVSLYFQWVQDIIQVN